MSQDIWKALRKVFEPSAVPGRDDADIQRRIGVLHSILEQANNVSDHEKKRIQDHTQFYLEQTLDRATRLLLSPKVTDKNYREGLMSLREDIHAIQQNYFTLTTKERFIIHQSQHQQHSFATDMSATRFKHIPYSTIEVSRKDQKNMFSALSSTGAKREKRYVIQPKHAGSGQEWNLELICAPVCWDTSTGQGVRIGVIDSGVDYTHELLTDRFEINKGYDFVNNTDNPQDDNGHGTHVAGSVAAKKYGVAPQATLYALKFLDQHGSGWETDFLRAAEWAIDYELDIVNGSFGSNQRSDAEEAMCDALQQNGVLFVAAAGNSGGTAYGYPASYDSVLSVAAVDKNKELAFFSQKNDQIGISAPGVDVKSTIPEGTDVYSGTSMACPHVTGSCALAWNKELGQEYVRELIQASAEPLGEQEKFGAGLARPDKALAVDEFRNRWAS